ncbi:MAG: hypothetical protein M1479_04360 [Actinobacteria bacterium]|nr:hypothetical protein [Cyanobacteriota bacterium]MCL5771490.1 hypothetical protein [Actinomycetota bacterium]
MNSKERVQIAINHNEPDRVPIQAHFTPECAKLLTEKFDLRDYDLEIFLGNDILCIPFGMVTGYYREEEIYKTEWGITWKRFPYFTKYGIGYYTEIIDFPLADDSNFDSFKTPDVSKVDYSIANKVINNFGKNFSICCDLQCSLFEGYKYLRGLSKAFEDLLLEPERVSMIIDRLIEYHSVIGLKLIDMGADIIWLGDDLGGQNTMLMSPEIFRKVLKPKMAKIINIFKRRNKDIKIAFHTDGYVIPIIDDLIEVGVDILNPIQPESMNPYEIKKRWNKNLCLWGSISVQSTFPFGTKKEIIENIKERLKFIGPGGGFIIGPTHNIQIDTPLENILAFFNTVKNFGRYPIKI